MNETESVLHHATCYAYWKHVAQFPGALVWTEFALEAYALEWQ